MRRPFPPDFPDVVIQQPHGSPVRANQHPDYPAAKAGDAEAAANVVDAMVTPEGIAQVRAMIGDRKPIVVAPHAEEATGRNAIPERYAYVLSRDLRLPLDEEIVQANRPQRTGQSGEYRLAARAEFDGAVQAGRDYLLVDDNVVESGCGAVTVGRTYLFAAPFRLAVPHWFDRGSVSTPRSSNRTCRFPASGSRTRRHAFVHATSCPSRVRRTSPKCP